MVKYTIITFLCFGLISSCAPTRRLEDGTKVLANKYNNIDKFDPSIYEQIDTNYFYKEANFYFSDLNFKKIRDYETGKVRKLQFYPGGYVRILSDFRENNPDPKVTGMRGVIYRKDTGLRIDSQGSDQDGTLFRRSYKVKVEGDKIYLLLMRTSAMFILKPSEYMCSVYEKSEKVPEDWKQYKPDW